MSRSTSPHATVPHLTGLRRAARGQQKGHGWYSVESAHHIEYLPYNKIPYGPPSQWQLQSVPAVWAEVKAASHSTHYHELVA